MKYWFENVTNNEVSVLKNNVLKIEVKSWNVNM